MPENKYNLDPELTREFIDESLELLDKSAGLLLAAGVPGHEDIHAIFRTVHSIKGNAAFFNLLKVKSLAHAIEDIFNLLREDKACFSAQIAELALSGINELKLILSGVKSGKPEVQDEARYAATIEKIKSELDRQATARSAPAQAAVSLQEQKPQPSKDASKTMRISEETIDRFLDHVGELVIVGEMYDHIHKRLMQELGVSRAAIDFKKNNDAFNLLSLNLQKSILDIRKVPIGNLLARAPLIVHEVSSGRGKRVRVLTQGSEVLIDKSLIENLEAPFMHILRNCVDHGIEAPEKRASLGKPPEGSIRLAVSEEEEKVQLVIEDDGAGLDKEAILKKAANQGLLGVEDPAKLSEEEIYQFIFLPGFSTASQVTDISGRGVGMDVVKKNVEGCGGKIIINSNSGKGTKFTIILPKSITVKIMEGVLVSSSQQRFVLPMVAVGESFEIDVGSISRLPDGSECIMLHDKVMPLVRLAGILGLPAQAGASGIGMVILNAKKPLVLAVDEILGLQQVVVKKIEGIGNFAGFIAGGAILGDEAVAIVLDTEKL